MYQPSAPPSNPADFAQWAMGELVQLARLLNDGMRIVVVPQSYVEPARPREGMIVNADGTEWDPGDGAGLYQYLGGVWVALGGGGGASPGGSDTHVQFNDGGSFGGDADMTWNKTSNTLTFGGSSATPSIIRGQDTTGTTDGVGLKIQGGDATGTSGRGGSLAITGGVGKGNSTFGLGGDVLLTGGTGGTNSNFGGTGQLKGGSNPTNVGGPAKLVGGDGSIGGDAEVTGGTAGGTTGGHVKLTGGAPNGASARGNVYANGVGSALSTSATGGFFHVPNCSGTPSGTPAASLTGNTPLLYDTSAHKLWAYSGSWRSVALT